MIADLHDLRRVLRLVFSDRLPPAPLHLVEGTWLVAQDGFSITDAAKLVKTSPAHLRKLLNSPNTLSAILGGDIPLPEPQSETRVRSSLGQLVLGSLAEQVFEKLYRELVGTSELQLRDDRSARGDTDYLVFNGSGRQVFRINIKFHGSLFRRARELVGLEPENCFALAIYKIYAALKKQEEEHLPYIFVIVGVPGLTGSVVGEQIPEDLMHLSLLSYKLPRLTGKRQIEDQIVRRLTSSPEIFGFAEAAAKYLEQIRSAQWFVLSARRADTLLRKNLFDRAYGLRVRGFTRNYAGAELDMHFSLSEDLRPLTEFLQVLRDYGMPGLVSRLERGTI